MSEMKHTKGPWVIHESNAIVGEKLDDHPIWLRPVIARFATGVRPADARLMAAAPDLLNALEAVLNEFAKDGHGGEFEDGEHPYVDAARAAIAKATGGQP